MSKNLMSLSLRLGANISDFQTKMRKASNLMAETGKKMQSIGGMFTTAVTLPTMAAGVASLKMASDFQESLNKVQTVFGESSKEISEFAKTTLDSFGIAEGKALDMAALFGDMGTSMGLSAIEAATMAKTLTGLSGDMASFKNIGIEQAMNALSGVFTGETESLKGLGIVMTQSALQAYAMEKGIAGNLSAMSEGEKVALRYQFILDKTKNSQGDYARTAESAANQTRAFTGNLQQIGATIGQYLLPYYERMMIVVNESLSGFRELTPATQKIIIGFAALAAATGPLLTGLGLMATKVIPLTVAGVKAATVAFTALKFAFVSTPLGALITGLAAGAAAIAIFRKETDTLTEAQKALLEKAKDVSDELGNQLIRSLGAFDVSRAADGMIQVSLSVDKLKARLSSLTKNELETLRQFLENQLSNATRTAANSVSEFDKSLQQQRVDNYTGAISVVTSELGKFKNQFDGANQATTTAIETTDKATDSLTRLAGAMQGVGSAMANMNSLGTGAMQVSYTPPEKQAPGVGEIKERGSGNGLQFLQEIIDKGEQARGVLVGISEIIAQSFAQSFEAALTSGQDFFKTFGKMLLDIVKKLVAAAVAAFALAVAISLVTGGTSQLAIGGKLVSGFNDIFKGLFSGMAGIPGMASGGIVPAGYPNDSYPAFLSSGEQVTPPNALPSGNNVQVNLRGRLEAGAKGIRVMIEGDQRNLVRRRGY